MFQANLSKFSYNLLLFSVLINNKSLRGPSTELFDLVQSLTGPERRFFQLQAHRHVVGEANNYWLLYTLVSDQDAYDEQSLKEQWAKYGNPNHFAVIKQQLYQQLLHSLHLFHSVTNKVQQVTIALHQADILLSKGLYQQAEKLLKKQNKLIEQSELLELWPEYYRIMRKLNSKQYYKGISQQELEALQQNESEVLTETHQVAKIAHVTEQLAQLHYSKVSGRSVSDLSAVDGLLASLPEIEAHRLRTKLDVLQAKATGNFMKGNTQEAYSYNTEFLKLVEQNGAIEQYAERYFSVLNNVLVDSQVLGYQQQVVDGLKKLRGLESEPVFKKIAMLPLNIFRLGYQLELNLTLSVGNFEAVSKLAAEVDAGLKKFEGQIVAHNVVTFQYLLAYLFVGNQQYQSALDRLAIIINDTDDSVVQEIQGFARLLNLVAHYEAGHYRLLESMIESVYRYQKQRQQLYEVERQVLSFLRKVNFVEERHIREALFRALYSRMEDLRKIPSEARAFNYFDFGIWAQAHLKRQPLATVFRSRIAG